jgi:NAD(P)-dependent dehydrogenase (short-subunit alcohol dehydrogenase family)
MSANLKVCLIIGAGAGIGAHAAYRFAREGYYCVLARRSDQAGLDAIVSKIVDSGGQASGVLINVADPDSIESLVSRVERDIGPIAVAIYNIGAQIGNRSLEDTTLKQFELGWRLGTYGLFRLAKVLMPLMQARQVGVLLVTSSTASVRGNNGQSSHASAMAGRRMLCQSLNAQFAGHGIKITHFIIDGAVDAPDTLGKMVGQQKLQQLRDSHALISPAAVADTYFHMAHQPRSAWSHEVDIRAFTQTPWWNSPPQPVMTKSAL